MDPSTDTPDRPSNWARLTIIATALVVSFALLIWICTALKNCQRRRPNPTTMPGAYLLPVYAQPHLSTSTALSRSTLVYPLYPAMPSPDYSEQDLMAGHYARVATPLQARTRTSYGHSLLDGVDEEVHVFGSVQRGHSRRHHRIHPALRRERIRESARESVETLPRYEAPPSYKSNNGFAHSG
jgi:hypothetical protein